MPLFLIGDEQGYIKSLEYGTDIFEDGSKYKLKTLSHRTNSGQKVSIQRMALSNNIGGSKAVITAYSDGIIALSISQDDNEGKLQVSKQWQDSRFKKDSSYIGLSTHEEKVYSCTTNGALQLATITDSIADATPTYQRTSLPTRLHDWKLSPCAKTFAYGGDEVELSVWDTENAFHCCTEILENSPAAPKKRKRNNELFPGEIWRAKNVANDSLGLRQPIRITSVEYLPTSSASHHIVTGTQLGDIRYYDTRAARRPVADWKGVGRVGGIQVLKRGLSDHELFVSDCGTNLFSLDIRNGRVVYGYKGLSGSVTSMAFAPGIMVSTANDRYARVHTTFAPPVQENRNIDHKGEVLEKVYVTTIPTVAIWDDTAETTEKVTQPTDEQDNDVWDDLEQVGDSDTEGHGKPKRHHIS